MFTISAFLARAFTKARELLTEAERVELQPITAQAHTEPHAAPRRKSTHARAHGEASGAAKLNARKVKAIRRAVAAGAGKRATARKFGVCDRTVRLIVGRETWRDVA
jgi:hypothetical protein